MRQVTARRYDATELRAPQRSTLATADLVRPARWFSTRSSTWVGATPCVSGTSALGRGRDLLPQANNAAPVTTHPPQRRGHSASARCCLRSPACCFRAARLRSGGSRARFRTAPWVDRSRRCPAATSPPAPSTLLQWRCGARPRWSRSCGRAGLRSRECTGSLRRKWRAALTLLHDCIIAAVAELSIVDQSAKRHEPRTTDAPHGSSATTSAAAEWRAPGLPSSTRWSAHGRAGDPKDPQGAPTTRRR